MSKTNTPSNWTLETPATLLREFTFSTFSEAAAFVTRLALLAEQKNHHPDIHWQYTNLAVRLTTHDKGGLSPLDFAYAEAVNAW